LTHALAGLKEGEKCREKGYFFTLPPDSDLNGSLSYKNSVKVVNPKRGSRGLLHFSSTARRIFRVRLRLFAIDKPQYDSGHGNAQQSSKNLKDQHQRYTTDKKTDARRGQCPRTLRELKVREESIFTAQLWKRGKFFDLTIWTCFR